jgi:hypothetical protein
MAFSINSVAGYRHYNATVNAPPSTGWDVQGNGTAPAPTIAEGACDSGTTTTTTPAPSYINFPASPSTGQTYSFNGIIWTWNGVGWKKRSITPAQDIFMSNNYGGL